MNTQPEALRLADELCAAPERSRTSFEAAAELRRLHKENQQFVTGIIAMTGTVNRLKALNQELLDELIKAVALINDLGGGLKYRSAAIAKAQGEQA